MFGRTLITFATALAVGTSSIAIAAAAPHFGGAPAVPRVAAPAPHFAVPQAHFAAPHFAARPVVPHFAAPQAHFAAPQAHFAAPHFSSRSHFAAPHFAQRRAEPGVAAQHFASHLGSGGRAQERHERRGQHFARHGITAPAARHPQIEGRGLASNHRHEHLVGSASSPRPRQGSLAAHAFGHQLGNSTGAHTLLGEAAGAGTGGAPGRLAPTFEHGHFGWHHFSRREVGWAGPVFWPYAYDDLFGYIFWPYPYGVYNPYDDLFWEYGYDDLFGGIYLPYGYAELYGGYGPGYAYASQPAGGSIATASRGAEQSTQASAKSLVGLCGVREPNAVRFPIARIAKAVRPTPEQRTKLDALEEAETKAEKELKSSCVEQMPETPVGRLDAVQQRLQAMLEAVDIVRAPLDDFYASLTDEQKAQFNQLGEGKQRPGRVSAEQAALTQICNRKTGIPAFSIQRIDKAVQPDKQQQAGLDKLRDAATKAAATINATCPSELPLTPPGRLDAVHARLEAMLQAAKAVRPALQQFFASLDSDQKARFNAMSEQEVPPAKAG
jgi:LTXXQ motif family protein